MSDLHNQSAKPAKKTWVPGDELFFQILGVAVAIFLLKSALSA